jgi:hypothetical protein
LTTFESRRPLEGLLQIAPALEHSNIWSAQALGHSGAQRKSDPGEASSAGAIEIPKYLRWWPNAKAFRLSIRPRKPGHDSELPGVKNFTRQLRVIEDQNIFNLQLEEESHTFN